jgi:iron complex outermembrane receptor protein
MALCSAASPGHAQTTERSAELEVIVVTAQRREEDMQKAAIAITALDGEAVANLVSRPEELTSMVTGLNIAPSGGMTQIYIRGVGNLGGTSFAEGAVAFNVDQVYVGRPTAIDAVYYDLERVEVLKGPQGTLYGRNATGGAVNVVTNKPELGRWGGWASLDVGNYDLYKIGGALNVPMGDSFAMRFAAQSVKHEGYLSDGYNDQDNSAARVHLLFKPSDGFSLLLSADYVNQGGQGDGFTPSFRTCGDWCGPTEPENIALQRVGFFAPVILVVGDAGVGYFDNEFWSVTGDMEIDVGFGTISTIASHRSVDIDTLNYPSLFLGVIKDQSEQDSVEVRLASNGDGRLDWVLGGFYYNEDIEGSYAYSHGDALQSQIVEPDITNKSTAFFGQVNFSLTDTFRLTGGLRYTKDEKELGGLQRCYSGTLCGAPLGSGLPGSSIVMNESDSWDSTDYKVAVEWDVGDQSMLYATASTGFKSGGFYPAALDASFEPEELEAYAVGSKNRFLDNRLQVNVEAFYWDYTNHQESHVGTACSQASEDGTTCVRFSNIFLTENVGKSEIQGVDVDTTWLFTENDQLTVNVAYLDAEATEFTYNVPASAPPPANIECVRTPNPPLITVDCSGNQMPRAPEWTARLDYLHSFRLDSGSRIDAAAGIYYSDDYWASIQYTPGSDQESYTKSDASLTYVSADDSWHLALWIDNIEDEPIAGSSGAKLFANTPGVQLRAPRTYGVRWGVKY